jgi:hypothetical protein
MASLNGKGLIAGGAAKPSQVFCLATEHPPIAPKMDPAQAEKRNPAAVAAARRDLNLEFLHECAGGIRIHAELAQTFAEIGDVSGTLYAFRRLFAQVKAAHGVYTELRDVLASNEGRAP